MDTVSLALYSSILRCSIHFADLLSMILRLLTEFVMVNNGSSASLDFDQVSISVDWDQGPGCASVFVHKGEYENDDIVCQPNGSIVYLP